MAHDTPPAKRNTTSPDEDGSSRAGTARAGEADAPLEAHHGSPSDARADEADEESFPASDPPGSWSGPAT